MTSPRDVLGDASGHLHQGLTALSRLDLCRIRDSDLARLAALLDACNRIVGRARVEIIQELTARARVRASNEGGAPAAP